MADQLLAIDPGNQESAYCLIDVATCRPEQHAKVPNAELLALIQEEGWAPSWAAVEMVASYGMAVGADVFETCVWIGRFAQALTDAGVKPQLVKRLPVKLHLCHSAKATDANIRQALVDRFASGLPNGGKGTKAAPGWFYGFAGDVWAAYALAVYAADQEAARA